MKQKLLSKNIVGFFIALAFYLSASEKANAQWVYIPDANFRSAIAAFAPAAIVGDSMNTHDPAISTIYDLDVSSRNINDLEGIEYLYGLGYLDCGNNQITVLPSLPRDIYSLRCNNNKLTSLPSLPAELYFLYCGHNSFKLSLPALPATLATLNCEYDSLTSLPPLPAALTTLICQENLLTTLPDLPSSLEDLEAAWNPLVSLPALPSSLIYLNCSYDFHLRLLPSLPALLQSLDCPSDSLTFLPSLPASLTVITCEGNLLTSLPLLPSSLLGINCSFNSLTSLPPLPSSLGVLICSYNHLTSLPLLPSGMDHLNCSSNSLSSLPSLPTNMEYLDCDRNSINLLPPLPLKLKTLVCDGNPISCLPLLPESLQALSGYNAGYTCLPNKPAGLTSIDGPDSLCTASNSSCYVYPIISGSVYNDDNLNTVLDNSEIGHPNTIVQVQPGNYFFPTNDTTYYSYVVDTGAAYTITANGLPYYNIVPVSQSTPKLTYAMVDSLNDFALQRVGIVHDLSVKATSFTAALRNGNMTHAITATNNGTVRDTASLQYVFDPLLTYVNSSPPADVVNGDTLQWNNIDLVPGKKRNFDVTLNVSFAIPLATDLYSYAVINPVARDTTPLDNVDTLHQVVVGSYDPNEITVDPPDTITSLQVTKGQWLDYIVRFQNTGNAPAMKVEVRDTLGSKLNLNTIQIISSSHTMTWSIRNRVAYFEFDAINLPDSTADETASHGFVRYRVKADTMLLPGDKVNNIAYIYFDANPAVVSNTASDLVYDKILSVNVHTKSSDLVLYPNPVSDKLFFDSRRLPEKYELKITDVLGQVVLVTQKNGASFIDVSRFSSGVYFLQIESENEKWINRFVKQ